MTRNTCMFHIGRSGSTVVADQLRQHPGLRWGGELLDPKRGRPGREEALQRVRQVAEEAGARVAGVEAKFYHLRRAGLDLAEFVGWLDGAGFGRFIVVRRRNLLRKIVSSQVARQSRRWHLPAGGVAERTTVRLDPAGIYLDGGVQPLVAAIERYEADFARLDLVLAGRPRLDLVYEDDIRPDPAAAGRRVIAFLGLDEHPLAVRLAPTTPWPMAEIVENFAEVRACLAGTPYAWMSDEAG